MKFKCKLKIILWEKDIKHGHFAKKIGISPAALSLIINDKSLPGFENTYKICRELNMKMNEIWVLINE